MPSERIIEFVARLRDEVTPSAKKVAEALAGAAKAVGPSSVSATKGLDASVGKVFSAFDKGAATVKASGNAVKQTLTNLRNEFPNLTRAANVSVSGFKNVANAMGQLKAAGSNVVSSLLSIKTLLVAAAAGFIANRTIGSLLATAEALDELNAASRRTGVAVEELSRLQVAAKLSNIEFGTLSRSLGILNRSIGNFGSNKAIREAFSELGISESRVKNIKSVADLLPDIADGLQLLGDARGAAVLQTLFGRGAFEIIPLLEGGAGKLRKSLQQVNEFGLVITANQAQVADELTDSIDLLAASWTKVKANIIEAIGPSAIKVIELFAKNVSALPERVKNIGATIGAATELTPRGDVARGVLRDTFANIKDLLLQLAVTVGKLIAVTAIEVATVGITALLPPLEALFRDALGPLLSVLPGVDIEGSTASKLAQAEADLRNIKGLNDAIEEARDRADRSREGGGLSADDRTAISLEAQRREILQRVVKLGGTIEDGEKYLDRKVKQLRQQVRSEQDTNLATFLKAVTSVGSGAGKVLEEDAPKIEAITSKLRGNVDEQAGMFREATEEAKKQSVDYLLTLRRFLKSVQDQAELVPGALRDMLAKVAELQKKLADFQSATRVGILRATGDDNAAAQAELQIAQAERRTRAQKELGVAFQYVADQLRVLEGLESRKLTVDQAATKVADDLAKAEINRSRRLQDVQAQQAAGTITGIQARESIDEINAALYRQAQAAIAALTALRDSNPEFAKLLDDRLQKAKDTAEELARLVNTPKATFGDGARAGLAEFIETYTNTFEQAKQLTLGVLNTIGNGVSSAFNSIIDGTKTVGEAFKDMARGIITQIAQMIIQMLIFRAIAGIFGGAFAGGGEALSGIGAQGLFVANTGGMVPGRGPNVDSVSARLTPGEFVQRRSAVDHYGSGIMEALNQRLIPRSILAPFRIGKGDYSGRGSFNTGGRVETGAPEQTPQQAVLVANERTMDSLLTGGPNAMIRWLQDNRNSVKAAIGVG